MHNPERHSQKLGLTVTLRNLHSNSTPQMITVSSYIRKSPPLVLLGASSVKGGALPQFIQFSKRQLVCLAHIA
jgi:hypothetical protein